MLAEVRCYLKPLVRQRAHGQGNPRIGEKADEFWIVDGVDAVIDALGLEQFESVCDIPGGAFLASVRASAEAELFSSAEGSREFRRRVAVLA